MGGLYGLSLFTTLASRKSLQAILATGSGGGTGTESRDRTGAGATSIHLTKLGQQQGTGRVPTQIQVHTVVDRAIEDEEEWEGSAREKSGGPRAHFV